MEYVLSGRVVHMIKENEKVTLCGKFIWQFESERLNNDFPELLCKRCKKSIEKIQPPIVK